MSRGGARPGAGRPAGAPNKATEALRALAAELLTDGESPLDFLTRVFRDEAHPIDLRVEAAGKAAPYVHPKLATITLKGDEENPVKVTGRIEMVPVEPQPRD
jgi:hypothetical protein